MPLDLIVVIASGLVTGVSLAISLKNAYARAKKQSQKQRPDRNAQNKPVQTLTPGGVARVGVAPQSIEVSSGSKELVSS